jgi:hypothetical protein
MAVNAQAYFAANPDVAASFASNNYGMTADEFANYHFANYGASESRTPPTGVTNEQILDFLKANPNLTDEQIVSSMKTYGISPSQMAGAVGLNEGEIASRVAATVPYGQTVTLGDTIVQPVYQVTGSGQDQQIGGLENVITYKATDNQAGGLYTQYTPTGEVEKTGTQQEVKSGLKEFALGAGLLFGGAALAGLGGGAGALGGAATAGTTGLTAGEIAALTAGDLAIGGGALAGTAPLTAAQIAALTAGDLAIGGGALAGTPPATIPGLLSSAATIPAAATTIPAAATNIPAALTAATTAAPIATTALTSLIPGAVNTLLNPTNLANLLTSGATTAAGLLQQQTSREAAIAAQQMIDRETAAAKTAAAFRPIGMTTRFGTSQFQADPVTGQLTSAGYTLSPEAKAQQDRLVALSNAGLTQAEAAQQQFAPLQTGAQRLFGLGNQYLAQTPESVAQNYLNQQMALLQPGRELELANLQNRLQQQGRGGLSVAQGGTMGATTPELQALYNARAQQEAVLAANAQQAGQQQVLFGAGLLGQGTTAMGNYYAGQQGAYAPYTTAMGQVTGLEALGQQPLNMSTALAQQTSQAGANVGRLGLSGAEFSTRLATSPAATTNPYSTLLGGVGSSNQFGQFLGGLFGGVPATTAMSAPATTFGTGNYYGNQDLGLYL